MIIHPIRQDRSGYNANAAGSCTGATLVVAPYGYSRAFVVVDLHGAAGAASLWQHDAAIPSSKAKVSRHTTDSHVRQVRAHDGNTGEMLQILATRRKCRGIRPPTSVHSNYPRSTSLSVSGMIVKSVSSLEDEVVVEY